MILGATDSHLELLDPPLLDFKGIEIGGLRLDLRLEINGLILKFPM